jgi:hypothetical protein
MPWATPDNVLTVTGREVDEALILRAQAVIESLTGLIADIPRPDISDRDLYWLRQATAYQAGWMVDNPDVFSRADVTSASQDGESAGFRNTDAHVLSPLARKAIRRLSWRGVGGVESNVTTRVPNVNSEAFDDSLEWKPL